MWVPFIMVTQTSGSFFKALIKRRPLRTYLLVLESPGEEDGDLDVRRPDLWRALVEERGCTCEVRD